MDGENTGQLPCLEEEDPAADGESTQSVPPAQPTENGPAAHSVGGDSHSTINDILSAPPSPTLSLLTKHTNGTLNLWQLTFADKTKFSQVRSRVNLYNND